VLIPEGLRDVREFHPGIHKHAVAMTGGDEAFEIVVIAVTVVEMPGRDVKRRDARATPAFCEVIEVCARAVRVIEECPQAGILYGGLHAQGGEGLQQIREAFIAVLTGAGGYPKDRSGTHLQTSNQRRFGPLLQREYLCLRRDIEEREFELLFPHDRDQWVRFIQYAHGLHGLRFRSKAEAGGEW
jgi:hypothetical protein